MENHPTFFCTPHNAAHPPLTQPALPSRWLLCILLCFPDALGRCDAIQDAARLGAPLLALGTSTQSTCLFSQTRSIVRCGSLHRHTAALTLQRPHSMVSNPSQSSQLERACFCVFTAFARWLLVVICLPILLRRGLPANHLHSLGSHIPFYRSRKCSAHTYCCLPAHRTASKKNTRIQHGLFVSIVVSVLITPSVARTAACVCVCVCGCTPLSLGKECWAFCSPHTTLLALNANTHA